MYLALLAQDLEKIGLCQGLLRDSTSPQLYKENESQIKGCRLIALTSIQFELYLRDGTDKTVQVIR